MIEVVGEEDGVDHVDGVAVVAPFLDLGVYLGLRELAHIVIVRAYIDIIPFMQYSTTS